MSPFFHVPFFPFDADKGGVEEEGLQSFCLQNQVCLFSP